jgi:hypothetical protein
MSAAVCPGLAAAWRRRFLIALAVLFLLWLALTLAGA